MTSETGGEDSIRRRIVDANLVDCIVTLPERLFYSTPIPAGIWILRKGRDKLTSGLPCGDNVLFIDASKLGKLVSRTRREFTYNDIVKISNTYRKWKDESSSYLDEKGFSRSVPRDEIVATHYNLLPSAYVQEGHVAVDGGPLLRSVITSSLAQESRESLHTVAETGQVFAEALSGV